MRLASPLEACLTMLNPCRGDQGEPPRMEFLHKEGVSPPQFLSARLVLRLSLSPQACAAEHRFPLLFRDSQEMFHRGNDDETC
jgi:hypothetical protein